MLKFSEMPYVRPDLAAYKEALTAHIQRVAQAPSWEALQAEWLAQAERKRAVTQMYSLASIRNRIDTRDDFYAGEMAWLGAEMPQVSLMERQADAALLASPFRKEFAATYGDIPLKIMESNQRFAHAALVPLQVKETELTQRFSKVTATATIPYAGKDANVYALLKEMQSTDRTVRKQAFAAWAALYEKIAPELDDLYDALVGIRVEMAQVAGFPSYTEMAYAQRRRFDYTPADVAVFRKQIRETVTPACVQLFENQRKRLGVDKLHWYDEALVFPQGNVYPQGTRQEQVEKAQKMYQELSPESGEYFDFMVRYELFDLDTKPGKRPGGFCSSLPGYQAPFIFANFNGTSADIGVLTHEAGHGFAGYLSSRSMPLPELMHSTSEINEIHSMAMEHFTYPWMEDFFGEDADKYRYQHLLEALNVLPYMCCVDDFQHRVYAEPTMTRAQRRAVWHELEQQYMPWRDYDGNAFLAEGAFWMQKQHIFLYPFYYVDYALAQTCAFQLYQRMQAHRETAWTDYLRLCKAGGSKGYFDLLKIGHLDNPFQEGTVTRTIEEVLASLAQMEEKLEQA